MSRPRISPRWFPWAKFNEGPFWVGSTSPRPWRRFRGRSTIRPVRITSAPWKYRFCGPLSHSSGQHQFGSRGRDRQSPGAHVFPASGPGGQSMTVPHWGAVRNIAVRIVGVVGHVEHYGLDGSLGEKPEIYYSFYQLPMRRAVLSQRITVGRAHARSRRHGYAGHQKSCLCKRQRSTGLQHPQHAGACFWFDGRQRFPMLLLGAFAVLALLLASVGIYGVFSYSMRAARGRSGFGMALGAQRKDVLRTVIGQGVRLALLGVAIGVVAALVLADSALHVLALTIPSSRHRSPDLCRCLTRFD